MDGTLEGWRLVGGCGLLGMEWNHGIEGSGRQKVMTSTIMLIIVKDTKVAAFTDQRICCLGADAREQTTFFKQFSVCTQ